MNVLITGGAGFIGANAASFYLRRGEKVIIFDNFSRKGGYKNILWLKKLFKKNLKVIKGDIRYDKKYLNRLARNVDIILHLAGQVAVTSSIKNPRDDFENNVLGTLNVLEAIRLSGNNPICIYSSSNKVYGQLDDLEIVEAPTRYTLKNSPFGIAETRNVDFYSPYGCSKGAAEQYVRDYARIYELNTIVFRQSCVYGPRQFGIEDQGWVAWFLIAIMLDKSITVYGNGKQVRDLLYIDDLLNAYQAVAQNIQITKGKIYNIGGGRKNTISVWLELKPILEQIFKKKIKYTLADWRLGDQHIFISDIRKAKSDFGWEPKISIEEGIQKLFEWVSVNRSLFKNLF